MAEKSHHLGGRSPEYALLGFLYVEPGHGYSLHRQLVEELGHVWHVSQSQSYAILKRLLAQGDIASTTQQQEKLPARQMLHITVSGRRRFKQWLKESSGSSVRAIRLEFITRLYFAQKLFPKLTPRLIEAEAEDIIKAITRLELARRQIPPEQTFNRLSLELRLQQLHAVMDWVIQCRKAFGIKS
jgi:DNA-binding PadR family transcriptional regulator